MAAPERARPRLSLLVGIALVGAAAATAVAYHAGAGTYVVVTLERHDDELDLTILDDGVGFDYSARAAGIGLVSMRDRLGAVGGDIGISSSPGAGTTIRAHVPDCRPAV